MPTASSHERVSRGAWVLRCAPGLARLLTDELRFERLIGKADRPLVLRQRNHDLLFLQKLAHPPAASELRLAEEAHRCPVYGRYKLSPSQLDRLAEGMKRCRLVVTADGNHFDRRDLTRFLTRELEQRRVRVGADGPELWVFAIDAAYYICRRLRDDGRAWRVAERSGSLPPTIAAALAFLGHPADADAILDPVCGSGTLLAEAHGFANLRAALAGLAVEREFRVQIRGEKALMLLSRPRPS